MRKYNSFTTYAPDASNYNRLLDEQATVYFTVNLFLIEHTKGTNFAIYFWNWQPKGTYEALDIITFFVVFSLT